MPGLLVRRAGGVHRGRRILFQRCEGGVHLVGAVAAGADLGGLHIHRLVGEAVRDVATAHDDGRRAFVGRAEHVLGQRVVQHRRVEDLFLGNRLAPERVRVHRPVAEVLGRNLGQRLLRDAVLVEVVIGLHPEELRGDELSVLGVPLRQCELGRVVGERPAGVLVHADGDADVVLAQPDRVRRLLNRRRRGRAGVEDVGERDPGETDQPRHRVGVRHLVAAAEAELNVLPVDAGVGERELDRVGAHLHCGLVEPAEGMKPHADDRDVVGHGYSSRPAGRRR